MDNLNLFYWIILVVIIIAFTIGTIVILRMRKRYRKIEKVLKCQIDYYEKGSIGSFPE